MKTTAITNQATSTQWEAPSYLKAKRKKQPRQGGADLYNACKEAEIIAIPPPF